MVLRVNSMGILGGFRATLGFLGKSEVGVLSGAFGPEKAFV